MTLQELWDATPESHRNAPLADPSNRRIEYVLHVTGPNEYRAVILSGFPMFQFSPESQQQG